MKTNWRLWRGPRGFHHSSPVQSTYGGEVRVYESSAAHSPHIWLAATVPADLNDPTGPSIEAHTHLSANDAEILRDQLTALLSVHYQLRDTPVPTGKLTESGAQIVLEVIKAGVELPAEEHQAALVAALTPAIEHLLETQRVSIISRILTLAGNEDLDNLPEWPPISDDKAYAIAVKDVLDILEPGTGKEPEPTDDDDD